MSVTARVQRVFTGTIPSRPVAVARIVIAGAALGKAADLGTVVAAMTAADVMRVPYGGWAPVPSTALFVALGVWVAAAVAFLVGWRTRWAGAALTGAMTAVLAADQQLYSNHLYLLILLALLLTLADSAAAISLDARRQGERLRVAAWPVTLLKIQLSVVYGFAALLKVNAYYLSGVVLRVFWVREGMFALPDALRRPEVLVPLALASVLAEAFIAVAIWFPRTRHAAFLVGLALHVAIVPTMSQLGQLAIFAGLMLPLYLLFLEAAPHSRLVVWDDACSFCRVWVRWLRRLDWLRVHRFAGSSDPMVLAAAGITTEEADTAIQLVDPAGRRASGFRAIRTILEFLPLSFLWAPILRIPPIERLGERVYTAVARRRKCAYPAPVRRVVSGTQHQ